MRTNWSPLTLQRKRRSMATLMMQQAGYGAKRRCDARCYDAKRDDCTCICGGLNHGAHFKQALNNMRDVFAPVLEKRHIEMGKKVGRIIADEQRQLELNLGADSPDQGTKTLGV